MSLMSIKVFVSSPGDVAQERFLTEKVIDRLQNVYRNVCKLEPIFWEHEPLTADKSFQEGLISPRETDIVICILWSRLGTRLPKTVTGDASLTGTEFEFEEAVEGRKQRGVPDLLVYRKTAKPFADLSDKLRRTEALSQIEALETFFDKWFTNKDGALIAAFHPFERADDFEEHVEQHLRKLIDSRLKAAGISLEDAVGPTPTWLEGSPFRGLEHFDFEHEPIFFGRTKAIGEVIDRLKRQAEARRAFLLVLGMSGSGKSSLIRAGVLPALSRPGVIEGVGLCRRVVFRPGDGLGDIFDALAAALLRKEALPELADDGTTAAQLAQSLRDNPAAAAMLVKGAISQAAGVLKPAEEGAKLPQARLLFVVDQLEEMFTNDKTTPEARNQFARLLKSLACDPLSQIWVIATLRSDFYAQLTQAPELAALKEGLGQYDLLSPSPAEIGMLVREPASAAGLRFEQKPDGERLDDVLRDEASQDASLLPLLEFTLNELYDRRTDRGKLTFEAYQSIGGVKGALAQRAESTFAGLPAEVQRELPAIFRHLVTIGTLSDETPTRQQTPLARFAASPTRMEFVRAFIGARLFVSDHAEDGSAVVRITHESLLARWERLQRWLADDRELLRVKGRVERAAARWLQEGRRSDLLLTAGKPLDEAEQLHAAGFELDPEVESMILDSRKKARRNRRLRQAAIASLAVLTLAASSLAVMARIQRDKADENSRRADENAQRANENSQRADENSQRADKNARRAETARDQARQRFQLALEAFNEIIFRIERKLENRPGTQALRKDLLENARKGLQKLLQESEKQGSPDHTLVWSYFQMGDLERTLGNTSAAKKEYEAGHELAKKLAAADPKNVQAQGDLSVSYDRLGNVILQVGRTKEALGIYQKEVDICQSLMAANPKLTWAQRDLSVGYEKLGDATIQLGRTKEALDLYEKALDICERLAAANPKNADAQRDLCVSYNKLGDVTAQLGRTQESLNFSKKGRTVAERLAAANPGSAEAQRDLSVSFNKLGYIMSQLGRTQESLNFYEKARAIRERLAAADPKNAHAQGDLSFSYEKLGNAMLLLGRTKEALDFYKKALAITERLAAADAGSAQAQRDLSVGYNKLGDVTRQLNRSKESLDFYKKALAIAERLAAADPNSAQAQRDLNISYNKLGDATRQLGRSKESLDFYKKALAIAERLAAADPNSAEAQRDLNITYNKLGDLTRQLGRTKESRDLYEKALAIAERLAAADPSSAEAQRDLNVSNNKLGDLTRQLGQAKESLDFYEKAWVIAEHLASANPINAEAQRDLMLSYWKIGTIARMTYDFPKAVEWLEKALGVANRFSKPEYFKQEVEDVKNQIAFLKMDEQVLAEASSATTLPAARQAPVLVEVLPALFAKNDLPKARQAAEVLAEVARQPNDFYHAAGCFARLGVNGDNEARENDALRAMELLRQAVAKGFKDVAALKRNKDLDSLRDRDDFKRLLAELEKDNLPKK